MGIGIQFTGIEKSYQTKSLYDHLTGTVSAGACTCVTGANGSGKSTFLKIIAALIRPSAGTITYTVNGRPVSIDKVRSQIALIAPEMQFYETLTAAENLAFFVGMTGTSLSAGQTGKILNKVNLSQAAAMQVSS